MTTVYQYKIYCNTESTYVEGWGQTPPTQCYNNTGHTVNSGSVQIINAVASNTVSITEDKIAISRTAKIFDGTVGHVAFGTTASYTFTFPVLLSFYSFQFITDASNTGDDFSIVVNEDTTLGLITADQIIGDTIIHAPAALMLYGLIGYHIKLTDGTNTNDLGMITDIDKVNNTVTTLNATTFAFSATNTLCKMTIKVLDNIRIGGAGIHKFCEDIIGGTVVPKGTVVKLYYTNNATSGADKSLTLYMTTLC